MKWISVKDRMPDHNNEVLVYAPELDIIGPELIGNYFDDDETWTAYDFHETNMNAKVTHWMPLPNPPEPEHEKD